ncbi:DUF429 domain-containing protein [Cupriavidus lacunae]|uniref:DUF429 domain-containing protein n=1 Tax=Cupriavidus lacunae TaxID=2666307 RepID=A0A370NLH7_9BURK|nr:DUF429 domain-containing protein [Cupriavidus lacunae]RDK06455.1 DUF429 domain-containing protein [Cupriavidus lacunae]
METNASGTVAGIDIGGARKGCHLVILRGREIDCVGKSSNPGDLYQQCLRHNVAAVGIDSPCRWSLDGAGRLAEKELSRERIFCFSTPTQERALASTSGFYGWMFSGERVFQTFAPSYPLLTEKLYLGGRVTFETFPHAITCSLLGKEVASAKLKRVQRRKLLEDAGIDTRSLTSIDAVDAALCALTAQLLLRGKTRAYGDGPGGYIFVPDADIWEIRSLL